MRCPQNGRTVLPPGDAPVHQSGDNISSPPPLRLLLLLLVCCPQNGHTVLPPGDAPVHQSGDSLGVNQMLLKGGGGNVWGGGCGAEPVDASTRAMMASG